MTHFTTALGLKLFSQLSGDLLNYFLKFNSITTRHCNVTKVKYMEFARKVFVWENRPFDICSFVFLSFQDWFLFLKTIAT